MIPYMQLYVADYMADTRHLTCEQDGAYMRLLMAMWRSGGSLPADPSKLARITGLSLSRWTKVCEDVLAFFEEDEGFLTQSRLTKELKKAEEKSTKRSEAGKYGATAKALKSNNTTKANDEPLLKHYPEPEPEYKTDDDSASANDWPADRSTWISEICRLTGCADVERSAKDAWPVSRSSREAIIEWNRSGVAWSLIIELIPQIIARKRDGPPRSFAYFTAEILQTHVNRTKPVTLPEPTHDQRDKPYRTTGQRNEDSTVRAFQAVFGRDSAGQDEPVNPAWPDRQDGSEAPLRVTHGG